MNIKIITLVIFILLLSGCVATQEIKEAEIQRLQERISYLERQLKQKEEENIVLRKEFKRKEEERIVLKMPNAKEIQTALKNAGFYDGEIDGVIGEKTKEAIKEFQKANGLDVDGVVGSRTWEKLRGYLNS